MLSWKVLAFFCGLWCYYIALCSCKERLQFVLEHPNVTYINQKYLSNLTITSRRYSRRDPNRYLSMYMITNKYINKNYSVSNEFVVTPNAGSTRSVFVANANQTPNRNTGHKQASSSLANVSVYFGSANMADDNLVVFINFYELLSNVYKPTFVTLHFDNYCDMIEKDTFIGTTIVEAYVRSTPEEKRIKSIKCPLPPGEYACENITVPYHPIINRFPFTNGRIFVNLTYNLKETVAYFHVDLVIK